METFIILKFNIEDKKKNFFIYLYKINKNIYFFFLFKIFNIFFKKKKKKKKKKKVYIKI